MCKSNIVSIMIILFGNPGEKWWQSLRAAFILQWGVEFRTHEHQNHWKRGQIVKFSMVPVPNCEWLQSSTILWKIITFFYTWFSLIRTFLKLNLSYKIVGLFHGPDEEYPVPAKIDHSNTGLVPFHIHFVFVSLDC